MVVTDGKSRTEFLSTETFIQTFDKYFDSTINVAFQIDFFKKLREIIHCPSAVQALY